MEIIFGLIGLCFLVVVFAGFVFLAVFLARKIGLLKPIEYDESTEEGHLGKQRYAKSISAYKEDFRKLSDSLVFRFITIAVLIVLMMIPLNMVNEIVAERNHSYKTVLKDIANTWGHKQNIKGPSLYIPYTEKFITEEVKTDSDGYERKVNKTHYKQRTAIVLPNDLKIDVDLKGEARKRDIYKATVYSAQVKINGDFKRPDIKSLSNHIDKIHWDSAWLSIGISDTQAINEVSKLVWNNAKRVDFEPGTRIVNLIKSGFHAPLDLSEQVSNKKSLLPFSLGLNINGSSGFYFSPFGKNTDVNITSDWPHPSFQGNVLPDNYKVNDEGFNAKWRVPHLARNYPQLWTLETQKYNINEFNAGVNLFETVSLYSQITRAIKYGLLFFTLTYITFLIFELGIGRRLHIVQYGVIGLALSMFYLTLLSMAEHYGFFNAYILAASIIIVMISLYAYAAIRSLSRMTIISGLLIGLYSLLYSLLKLENNALMAGTGLLLFILAVLMYLTRNIGYVSTEK